MVIASIDIRIINGCSVGAGSGEGHLSGGADIRCAVDGDGVDQGVSEVFGDNDAALIGRKCKDGVGGEVGGEGGIVGGHGEGQCVACIAVQGSLIIPVDEVVCRVGRSDNGEFSTGMDTVGALGVGYYAVGKEGNRVVHLDLSKLADALGLVVVAVEAQGVGVDILEGSLQAVDGGGASTRSQGGEIAITAPLGHHNAVDNDILFGGTDDGAVVVLRIAGNM